MSIQLLKPGVGADTSDTNLNGDMDVYKKELRAHRLRSIAVSAGVFAVVILCLLGIWFVFQNRTYEVYEVVNSFDRSDTMTTKYTEFLNYVLKYGKEIGRASCRERV